MPFFCAVPDDAPVRAGGIATLPMAGPYYVQSVIAGPQIVLARNPNYRGPRPARLDAIDITIGAPPATAIARVIAGAEDYYPAPAFVPNEMPPTETSDLLARYGARARTRPPTLLRTTRPGVSLPRAQHRATTASPTRDCAARSTSPSTAAR